MPGWDSSYKKEDLKKLFEQYAAITKEDLWENLRYFLGKVIPVAEECGVNMAIHPDDPPWDIFGLPRLITDEAALDRFLSLYDSPCNGLTFCTGSLGSSPQNDIPAMVEKYSAMGRIHFMHLRNVKWTPQGGFEESGHLTENGSLDMAAIIKALKKTGFTGYVRPDHGRMIWGETGKPGTACMTAHWAPCTCKDCGKPPNKERMIDMSKLDLPYTPDLTGRTAVVTGAGGVLCSIFARALAQCGANVALLDKNEDAAQKVAASIEAYGGRALAVGCDVLDKSSLQAAHKK